MTLSVEHRALMRDGRLVAEVVIPVRWDDAGAYRVERMTRYLAALAQTVTSITVVDGSPAAARAAHETAWGAHARVIVPVEDAATPRSTGRPAVSNGKVVGAMTGIREARHDTVVLADDDVRHTPESLRRLVTALGNADLVRPLNVYDAWPWQARWDGARTLLNVALGTDWPGTFALRRSTVLGVGGWSPRVLFENLELWRTVGVAGHVTLSMPEVLVQREPPSVRQFWSQRVRQAYDDLAQPGRLLVELAILPAVVVAARRGLDALGVLAAATVLVAAAGRRALGADHVPPTVPLWAPVWVLERGLCVWLALGIRARGGMRYRGSRLRVAAHSRRQLACRACVRDADTARETAAGRLPGSGAGTPSG